MPPTRAPHPNATAVPYAAVEVDDTQESDACGVVVEARLFWGKDLLGVRHVAPRRGRPLRIADLGLPIPCGDDVVVARSDGDRTRLVLPAGVDAPPGCRVTLRLGRSTLRLALVPDDADTSAKPIVGRRVAGGVVAAALLHLVVTLLFASGEPAPRVGERALDARASFERYLATAEEHARAELEGAMDAPPAAPASIEARADVEPAASRHGARAPVVTESPAHFGVVAVIAQSAARVAESAFARADAPAARDLFATSIHDVGGGVLSGIGEGGGGLGAGVPMAGYAAFTRNAP